jgi:hypothetical protein
MNQPLEASLNDAQLAILRGLTSPYHIQAFLDTTLYRPEYSNLCPLRVIQEGKAHCLDGGVFAAAALRRLGHPPLLVDIFPDPGMDDDHVLAIYKQNGRYGAVAKSNFVGLRMREPVYARLRELVMSYFEQFYNVNGVKTLRSYTMPVNLARFDGVEWETQDSGVDAIEKTLLARRRYPLISAEMAAGLSPVDEITYKAGLSIANADGLYRPKG